jgi:hypothetical protein
MGATNIITTATGRGMKDAFANACQIARDERGNNAYNGTISTTKLVMDATLRWIKSGMPAEEFANFQIEEHAMGKWECWGIDLGKGKYMFFGWAST